MSRHSDASLDLSTDLDPGLGSDFYQVGGTLNPAASCYIERQADRILMESLRRGEICYLLCDRQVGKSSLLAHAYRELRAGGAAVVYLDLSVILTDDYEQWYYSPLHQVAENLGDLDEVAAS